ncbi:MAG: hypothetical protein AAFV07_13745 [Bacteroidota bacterium]
MKKIWITSWLCMSCFFLSAQIDVDVMGGTSKADQFFGSMRASWVGERGFRLGAQLQAGTYRYRFIDARPVEGGAVSEFRFFISLPLAVDDRIRLDAHLHPGIRFMDAPTGEQEFKYDFQDSRAITLDPGLVATFFPAKRWAIHTGISLRMVWQISPEVIFEQFPSGMLRVGGTYALSQKCSVFADVLSGPNSGASGDTEKYGWQVATGVRFRLGKDNRHQLITGF